MGERVMPLGGHPAPAARPVALGRLWFGLFAAPAAWSTQVIVNYALVAHFCYPNREPLAAPTFGGVRLVGIVVSVAAVAVALAALGVARGSWRATHGYRGAGDERLDARSGRAQFMAMAGLILSGVFLFAVLMNAAPLVALPVCPP